MKRKIALIMSIGLLLCSCGETNKPNDDTVNPGGDVDPDGGDVNPGGGDTPVTKKDFSNVKFESLEVYYDGNSHILNEVVGAPENTTITYTNRNSYVDIGEYNASATLEKEGYNTITLNATLKILPIEFSGLTVESKTINFDNTNHIDDLKISGTLPDNAEVKKEVKNSNGVVVMSAIDSGIYSYTFTISNKNYVTKTLKATLTISPINFGGFTYESKTVTYDGLDHFDDVNLVGNQPNGTVVNQVVKNSNGVVVTSAIEVGTYSYKVTITNKNYNTLTLEATLKIKAETQNMPVYVDSNNNVYFANGLHNNYLYKYSNSTVSKEKSSIVKEFLRNNTASSNPTYLSGTSILSSVHEITTDGDSLLTTQSNISSFAKKSDNVYYYSSNSLSSNYAGIYKVETNSSDELLAEKTTTKLIDYKADNLYLDGNYLYFTNENSGDTKGYIYKLNLTNNTTSLVLSAKVHEYTIYNGKLYCVVNGTLNDYIGYISLSGNSTTPTKITNASGEFLTRKGNYLYYNYTDLYSVVDQTKLGIYRIDLSTNLDTKVLDIDGINGFDVDSNGNIYYIDSSNLHLYKYDVNNKTKVDYLSNFVIPEETPLNLGGKNVLYDNKLYYLDMYNDKHLFCYDTKTGKKYELTDNKVMDFTIQDDKLYFNQVSMLTNNDLFVLDLTLSNEASELSSNDVRDMIFDGDYIYGVHYNWAGVAGGMFRMNKDGSNYVKFSDVNGAKNLTIKDGKLYYINKTTGQDNGNIEYITLSDIDTLVDDNKLSGTNLSSNISNVKEFIIENNNIYYIYNGTVENSIRRTSFSALDTNGNIEEGTKIASSATNPNTIISYGNYIYYYSHPMTISISKSGIYRVRKDATEDKTYELLLGYDNKYYASNLVIDEQGKYMYFFNYIVKLTLGDAHTYRFDLSSKEVKKIA